MKFYTKCEYVNLQTGEIISKSEFIRNKMIKRETIKRYNKQNDEYTEIRITITGDENRQQSFKFD